MEHFFTKVAVMFPCVCVHAYVCMRMCACVCVHAYVCMRMCTCMHARVCARTHMSVYTCSVLSILYYCVLYSQEGDMNLAVMQSFEQKQKVQFVCSYYNHFSVTGFVIREFLFKRVPTKHTS